MNCFSFCYIFSLCFSATIQGPVKALVWTSGGGGASKNPQQHHAQPAALHRISGQTFLCSLFGLPTGGFRGEDR